MYSVHNTPVPFFPDNILSKNLRSGQAEVSKKISYGYSAIGNVTSKIDFDGLTKAVTTSYVYDNFGNATQVTVASAGLGSRINQTTYDAQGDLYQKNSN